MQDQGRRILYVSPGEKDEAIFYAPLAAVFRMGVFPARPARLSSSDTIRPP